MIVSSIYQSVIVQKTHRYGSLTDLLLFLISLILEEISPALSITLYLLRMHIIIVSEMLSKIIFLQKWHSLDIRIVGNIVF